MTRDSDRSAVYATERLVHTMVERSRTVHIANTAVTMPPEARFSSSDDVARYVDDVLAMPIVRQRFPRAAEPVRVRRRRGSRAAHYERSGAVIAVPDTADGGWALRELVVLHEIAHHLDPVGSPAHGHTFVDTLIDLVGVVLGAEAGFVYRVVFGDSGLLGR